MGKEDFYEVIINSIKQTRQLMEEARLNHAIHAHVYEDEEDEFENCCKQSISEERSHNQKICFNDHTNKDREVSSHYI